MGLEVIKNQLVFLITILLLRLNLSYLVYVFVGDYWAMDDFMMCLQEKKLLDKGDYMVISVNDEFYNPDLKVQDSRQSEFYKRYECLMMPSGMLNF